MFCFHFVAVLLKLGLVSISGSMFSFSCCKICRLTLIRITYNLPILSYCRNPSQCPQRNPTKSEGPCEWRLTFEMPKQVCTSRYIHSWGIVILPSNGKVRDNLHMVQARPRHHLLLLPKRICRICRKSLPLSAGILRHMKGCRRMLHLIS